MSNSEQSNKPQFQLWKLVKSLDMDLTIEPDSNRDSYNLRGSANKGNYNKIQILIDALRDAGLISHAGPIGLEELKQGLVTENPAIKLDMQLKKHEFEVLIKTKDLSTINVDIFNRAVENAIKILSIHTHGDEANEPRILKMPSEPQPFYKKSESHILSLKQSAEIEIISEYLKRKCEETFPGSKPEITYNQTDPNFGAPAFYLTFSYNDKKDRTALSHFKGELSETAGTHSINHFRVNKDDSKIGLILSGNPLVLVGNIQRNEKNQNLLVQPGQRSR